MCVKFQGITCLCFIAIFASMQKDEEEKIKTLAAPILVMVVINVAKLAK